MAVRQALRTARRQQVSRGVSIPAGSGGWNRRDSLDQMKPEDAVILDNWIPEPNGTRLRRGFEPHATGLGAAVQTLAEWAGPSGRDLIAAANGKIWDVTSAAAATELATGYTSNKWQTANFMGRLFGVNGTDAPFDYNGTAVASTAWTGLTIANLIDVNVYRSRLWFVEQNTTYAWYGGVEAITGALTRFNLASVARRGGKLLCTKTWSRDSGNGPSQYIVFVMDTGECLVYQGADPGFSDFAIVARFEIGEPLTIRAFCNFGPDLLVLTRDGVLPFSQIMSIGYATQNMAISKKIGDAVGDVVRQYGATFGWEIMSYPQSDWIVVNVPVASGATQYQYVMNAVSGGWCRFKGMNANTFCLLNNDLYFGGNDGVVYKADTGTSDNGSNIEGDIQTAFNYCGSRGTNKSFRLVRPVLFSDGDIMPALDINTDFQSINPTGTPTFSGSAGTEWDAGDWDSFDWAGGLALKAQWISVNGLGYNASVRMQVATNTVECLLNSFDIVFENGGFM